MQDIHELLKSISPGYDAASGSSKLPDGLYNTQIIKMETGETQSGKPKLIFHLQVLGGEFTGMLLFFHRTVEGTEQGLNFLKRDLINLGYPAEAKLEDILDFPWQGLKVKALNKTSGQYTNVTPMQPLPADFDPESEPDQAAAPTNKADATAGNLPF